jgi:hypothetical protein
METQPGARTVLVDPFGRELEEWLRDGPAVRTPYVSDLVVPPVTGPITRPVDTGADVVDPADGTHVDHSDDVAPDAPAFRRERHGRRAAACAPSFPEPPERLALRVGDLAVLVSASSGRSTIERIDLFEQELEQRDADLARLAAWEAMVATSDDPEVRAARAFAHDVFADLLADAAAEADRRDRRSAALTGPVPVSVAAQVSAAPVITVASPAGAVRPETNGAPVSPVSTRTRPTPLVQPATGPSAIQRAAFEEAIRAHSGTTAEVPTVLPEGIVATSAAETTAAETIPVEADTEAVASAARPGWWARLVQRLLGTFGRRSAE